MRSPDAVLAFYAEKHPVSPFGGDDRLTAVQVPCPPTILGVWSALPSPV